jgi:periplasmic protein TonB
VTLAETLDTFEVVIGDTVGDDAAVDSGRFEPKLAAVPFFIEFDEPIRLDPERAGLIWEVRGRAGRAIRLRSPLVSLAFHLLPVVAVILLPLIMTEPPEEIPVQLVFEQPPPPPPPPPPQPQPQPAPKPPQPQLEQPPHGPLSSIDQGVAKPLELGRTVDPVEQPAFGAQQPTPAQTPSTATATSAAPPLPLPKPAPPKEAQATFRPPKPSGAPNARHEEIPHEAPHSARYAGPAASRDEYLAYLVSLTRQHINLLPMSMVGDRHGETVISLVIHDNGVIGPMSVLQSSGYPDIDHQVEQMIVAVGRAPPLPQWFQGDAMELVFKLKFPEALEQR